MKVKKKKKMIKIIFHIQHNEHDIIYYQLNKNWIEKIILNLYFIFYILYIYMDAVKKLLNN